MKKLMVALFAGSLLLACNNESTSEKKSESKEETVIKNSDERGDTSSYDRMPNKTSDSTQQ